MSLTFDTKLRIPATALTTTTGAPTADFTCGTNAEVLVVMVMWAGTTARTGGAPTYNSVALTQASSQQTVTETSVELWYLLKPPVGAAYSVVVPNDGGRTMWVYVASGNAASGNTCALDSVGQTATTGSSPSISITTVAANTLAFAVVATGDNSFAPTARTGTSLYEEDIAAYGGAGQYVNIAGTGATTISWTEATSDDYGAIAVAFKEILEAIALTVQTGSHTQSSGAIALAQHNTLVVQSGSHTHSSSAIVLTQHNALAAQTGSHTHTADAPVLTYHAPSTVLTVQNGDHTHKSYIDYLGKILGTQAANLIGAWALDEATGASTVNDYSPENNDGTPSNVTFGQTGIGDGRTSAGFNGTSSYINIYSAGFNGDFDGTQGTISAWVKVSAIGDWSDGTTREIIRIQSEFGPYILMKKTDGAGILSAIHYNGSAASETIETGFSTTSWIHICVIWTTTGDNLILYINGIQADTDTTSNFGWSGVLYQPNCNIGAATTTPTNIWKGNISYIAIWTKVLTDAEILSLWRVGLIQHNTLAIQNGDHTHTSSAIALAQHNTLAVQNGSHTHSGDNVALAQHNALTVQSGSHTHSADSATLTQHNLLVAQAGDHTHSSSAVILAQHNTLAIQTGSHTHSADNVILGMAGVLAVQDGSHTHSADTPALAQHNILATQNGSHTHTADSVILTQHNALAVQVGSHTHSADAPVLTYHAPGAGLTIQAGQHTHTAIAPTLTQHNLLVVQTGSHTQTSTNVILAQLFVLIVASGMHTQAASSPVLVYNPPGGVYQTTGMDRGMSRGIEREMI